ncbi:MAG: tyrosine-protein phosphatase [Chloroflexota bacterium]
MKILNIKGTYNVRDVGGMVTTDGKILREKVLIRSGNLDKLPESSQTQLINYGVRTVIDVRNEWENEHYPNVFQGSDAVAHYNLPLIGDALSNDEAFYAKTHHYVELHELYAMYVDDCQAQIGAIVSQFAESDGTTIVHCHAGKDRTGIITGLILALVGIADKHIAHDYAETRKHIQHLLDAWRAYEESKGNDMAQFERNNTCAPETMLEMLKHVRETYGDVATYLRECSVSEDAIRQVKAKLLG